MQLLLLGLDASSWEVSYFLIYFIIFKRTFFHEKYFFLSDELDLQIKCTGSLHLSTMSSVPSVQPLDSHMHLEAESCHPKASISFVCTMGLHHVTVPCHHLLFWCFSDQDPLKHTGMEGLDTVCSSDIKLWTSLCWAYLTLAKTWCHKHVLLPGL